MLERKVVVETREVSNFNQVVLRGSVCCAEVYIEQGETESLIIEAETELMPRIEARVRDRVLIIRLRGSWMEKLMDKLSNDLTRPKMVFRLGVRDLKGLDVYGASYVHIPSLEAESIRVNWRGAGNLTADSLEAQMLKIEQSGAGSMEISGMVDQQTVNSSGIGRYDGSRLITEHSEIWLTGSSYARIHATETLKAVVHGIGVVEYSGNPQVRSRVTGAGSVVRIE